MNNTPKASPTDPILLIAEHNKAILKRRFPDYKYEYIFYQDKWLQLRVSKSDITVLIVSFLPDSIRTEFPHMNCAGVSILDAPPRFTETISYADPRFTDNTLSDILERLA